MYSVLVFIRKFVFYFQPGERWQHPNNKCQECMCFNNKITCFEKKCPTAPCPVSKNLPLVLFENFLEDFVNYSFYLSSHNSAYIFKISSFFLVVVIIHTVQLLFLIINNLPAITTNMESPDLLPCLSINHPTTNHY